MDPRFIIYWLVLAIIVFIQHRLFAHKWRHHELARRTMGIATVMLGALPLTLAGLIDPVTWAIIFIAFGVCGAVVGAQYTHEAANQREQKTAFLKRLLWTHTEAIYEHPKEDTRPRTRIP